MGRIETRLRFQRDGSRQGVALWAVSSVGRSQPYAGRCQKPDAGDDSYKPAETGIYWGDETGLSNQDQIGRSYAPIGLCPIPRRDVGEADRGQTPIIAHTAKCISQSMIAAVSNRGLMRFMLYEGALDVERFIVFLRRLIKDAGQKVFLIVNNLKVHHVKRAKAWVESHAHEIELFYLPAYAPDHNPDEHLNNDLKRRFPHQPRAESPSRGPDPHLWFLAMGRGRGWIAGSLI